MLNLISNKDYRVILMSWQTWPLKNYSPLLICHVSKNQIDGNRYLSIKWEKLQWNQDLFVKEERMIHFRVNKSIFFSATV